MCAGCVWVGYPVVGVEDLTSGGGENGAEFPQWVWLCEVPMLTYCEWPKGRYQDGQLDTQIRHHPLIGPKQRQPIRHILDPKTRLKKHPNNLALELNKELGHKHRHPRLRQEVEVNIIKDKLFRHIRLLQRSRQVHDEKVLLHAGDSGVAEGVQPKVNSPSVNVYLPQGVVWGE